jgi:hypothetical protein
MASVYGMSGQLEEGRAVAAKIMKTDPGYCVEKGWLPYKKRPMRKPYGIVPAKWGFQIALQKGRVFQPMKIALATDASHPQISGVVTTLTQTVDHLCRMGHEIRTIQPDAVHIATEGLIGLCCRQYCRRHSLSFTTSFTTRFDEYIEMRSFIPGRFIFRLLK